MELINTHNSINKKLRGYQKASRDRFLLLSNKTLTVEEFTLYELCIAVTDWDRSHETFGTIHVTNKQLAYVMGWNSETTAGRHKNQLINKGFLINMGNGYFQVKDIEKWELRSKEHAKTDVNNADLHNHNAEIGSEDAEIDDNQGKKNDYSLISSKGSIKFLRSDSEYEEIKNSGQFGSMTIDDMKWIDLNVY